MRPANSAKVHKQTSIDSPVIDFWRDAFAIQGSITPDVLPNVFLIGLLSALVCAGIMHVENSYGLHLAVEIAPYEILGAALGLVLVLRTNTGYERWWEARKLWGGIVNQSRNLAIACTCYGPRDPYWQKEVIKWIAVFPHLSRLSLRGEKPDAKVAALLGPEATKKIAEAVHMPSQAALQVGMLLQSACTDYGMDRFAFLEADKERALLVDHIGACERILNTPLAHAYSIKIRRFITLFLLALPFALYQSLHTPILVPILSMLVAYPLFSFDALGVELQNPFSTSNLSHLPLDEISNKIEQDVNALHQELAATSQINSQTSA